MALAAFSAMIRIKPALIRAGKKNPAWMGERGVLETVYSRMVRMSASSCDRR